MPASARASEAEARAQAQLAALVVLAVEASADHVLAHLVVVGLGVGELRKEGCADPPVARRVMDRRPEEIRRVLAVAAREGAALVAGVAPVLDTGVPARQEGVGEAGGELELALALPLAVEALALRGGGQVRRPDQAIVEEVLLHDELAFELALVRSPARLDIEREADRVLVRAEHAPDPFVRQRLDEGAAVTRVRIDRVRDE